MNWLIGEAYAMAPGGGGGAEGPMALVQSLLPMVLIFLIFWFLFFRPQQKKAKQHRELVQNLKKGDEVYTDSGIRGTIQKVDPDLVSLEIAPKVTVRLQRHRVQDLIKESKGGGKAKADKVEKADKEGKNGDADEQDEAVGEKQ